MSCFASHGQFHRHANTDLPIVYYGAQTDFDKQAYVVDLVKRVCSQVTALDYTFFGDGHMNTSLNSIHYHEIPQTSLDLTMETFVLFWSTYLVLYRTCLPPKRYFLQFNVQYFLGAPLPGSDPDFLAITTYNAYEEYKAKVFQEQAELEAATQMLRQVLAQTAEMVPAYFLGMPGHSDYLYTLKTFGRPQIPRPTYSDPAPRDYPLIYKEVLEQHLWFVATRPILFQWYATKHATNTERMELYELTGTALPMLSPDDDADIRNSIETWYPEDTRSSWDSTHRSPKITNLTPPLSTRPKLSSLPSFPVEDYFSQPIKPIDNQPEVIDLTHSPDVEIIDLTYSPTTTLDLHNDEIKVESPDPCDFLRELTRLPAPKVSPTSTEAICNGAPGTNSLLLELYGAEQEYGDRGKLLNALYGGEEIVPINDDSEEAKEFFGQFGFAIVTNELEGGFMIVQDAAAGIIEEELD